MLLNDAKIRQAKPRDKTYKISDGLGLSLEITKAGAKRWRHRYFFDGKEKMLSLGVYPSISLQQARARRNKQREQIAQGINPSEVRQQEKQKPIIEENTLFKNVADSWYQSQLNSWEHKNAQRLYRRLENHIYPTLGKLPISEVDSQKVLDIFHRLEAAGKYDTIRKLRQSLDQIFRSASIRKLVTHNPIPDLRGQIKAPTPDNYPHPKTPKEIGQLLKRLEQYQGSPVVRIALNIAPLVFLRPSELSNGLWAEIDLEHGQWDIPAHRMKMDEPHIVPLSKQVIALLGRLKQYSGNSPYLFPSPNKPNSSINDASLRQGIRRLGYSKEELTTHGFRGMASTQLNELGYNRDWIERQLAHRESNSIRAAYNHAQYLSQRTEMMQKWADYLDQLKAE
jgi:integrase